MEKRKRRKFTPEFKAGAVDLVLRAGKTKTEVARDLGIDHTLIGEWVKRARIDAGEGPPGALTISEREELARLRKENRELRMERELLKKAAVFFAKENP